MDPELSSFEYNKPLFESMSRFEDAVWMIDLEQQEGYILHDRFTPSRLGMRVPLDYLLDIIYTRNNPFDANEMASHFTIDSLSALTQNEEYTSPSFLVNGEAHTLRYTLTPAKGPRGTVARVFVTFLDVQEMLDKQGEADRQRRLYQTVSHILSHSRNVNEAVNESLEHIGNFVGVSRIYVFENDPDDPSKCNNTFEWCNEGITPKMPYLQHLSYEKYGFKDLFRDRQFVCYSDVSVLPEFQRRTYEARGVKALMQYVFYDDDRLAGFIGLDCCKRARPEWKPDSTDQQMLLFVSELLFTFLKKERNLEHIKRAQAKEKEQHEIVKALSDEYITAFLSNPERGTMRMLKVNDELMELFPHVDVNKEYPHDELIGAYARLRVHPEDSAEAAKCLKLEHIVKELESNGVYKFNYRILNKEGEEHFFLSRHQWLPGTHEILSGYRCIDETIQYEREHQRILDEARAAHEYAEKTQQFMSSMSHEFRTPLNAIVGFTDMLCDPNYAEMISAEERADMGRLVRTNAHLLTMLVNDVLDISAAEAGRMKMNYQRVDVPELCREVINSVRSAYGYLTEAEFKLEGGQDDFWVITDSQRLSQVLYNLLSNAAKNTPSGTISLGFCPDEDNHQVQFWVKDTGCGIPAEKAEVIFDRFEKLDTFKQGTGLGLSICRAIAQRFGGNVWLDTSYTSGALFRFTHRTDLDVVEGTTATV